MGRPLAVLLVEDREDDALLIERCLKRVGYEVAITRVDSEKSMTAALAGGTFDVVLSDYTLPGFS